LPLRQRRPRAGRTGFRVPDHQQVFGIWFGTDSTSLVEIPLLVLLGSGLTGLAMRRRRS